MPPTPTPTPRPTPVRPTTTAPRVRAEGVSFVTIHKLDRLACPRTDVVEIATIFALAGTTLVSVLHGIMAAIEEP